MRNGCEAAILEKETKTLKNGPPGDRGSPDQNHCPIHTRLLKCAIVQFCGKVRFPAFCLAKVKKSRRKNVSIPNFVHSIRNLFSYAVSETSVSIVTFEKFGLGLVQSTRLLPGKTKRKKRQIQTINYKLYPKRSYLDVFPKKKLFCPESDFNPFPSVNHL